MGCFGKFLLVEVDSTVVDLLIIMYIIYNIIKRKSYKNSTVEKLKKMLKVEKNVEKLKS